MTLNFNFFPNWQLYCWSQGTICCFECCGNNRQRFEYGIYRPGHYEDSEQVATITSEFADLQKNSGRNGQINIFDVLKTVVEREKFGCTFIDPKFDFNKRVLILSASLFIGFLFLQDSWL